MPDFSDASLAMRLLASLGTLAGLTAVAAAMIVFAMMIVLFSLDGADTESNQQSLFTTAAVVIGIALGVAVLTPPILVACRVPTIWCLLPAGIGFVVAGITTLWIVVQNLGASS